MGELDTKSQEASTVFSESISDGSYQAKTWLIIGIRLSKSLRWCIGHECIENKICKFKL